MNDDLEARIERLERLAQTTSELATTQQEMIADLRQDLARTKAELELIRAQAAGASYLAGAALGG